MRIGLVIESIPIDLSWIVIPGDHLNTAAAHGRDHAPDMPVVPCVPGSYVRWEPNGREKPGTSAQNLFHILIRFTGRLGQLDMQGMADKTAKSLFRGTLLAELERPIVIRGVTVHQSGQFRIDATGWAEYWAPVTNMRVHQVDERLESLRRVWLKHIVSGFNSSHVADYCFDYFRLLHCVDALASTDPEGKCLTALRTVLAFECFAVLNASDGSGGRAAATITLRNPAYLMARLNAPKKSLDDTGYLPLITLAGDGDAELFYHYRQFTLVPKSPLSLLIFPVASNDARTASFLTIDAFSSLATGGADPRSEQRAKRIVNKVIEPLIRRWPAEGDTCEAVEIVDIGAGSGSLVSTMLKRFRTRPTADSGIYQMRVWFLDLALRDPLRFLRSDSVQETFDCVTFIAEDYQRWVNVPENLPAPAGIRIGVMSKLLNNLSRFDITGLCWDDLCVKPGAGGSAEHPDLHSEAFLDLACFGPEDRDRAGSFQNRRIAADSSCFYVLPSLSIFYRTMHRVIARDSHDYSEYEFYSPVRIFNEESLLSANGASMLEGLLGMCDLIFIEDRDLSPGALQSHIAKYSSMDIAAIDVSRTLRLRDNYAYLLWKSGTARLDLSFKNAHKLLATNWPSR